jgi:hypothetical protein
MRTSLPPTDRMHAAPQLASVPAQCRAIDSRRRAVSAALPDLAEKVSHRPARTQRLTATAARCPQRQQAIARITARNVYA